MDKNLGINISSVRCAIISDLTDENIYRHNPDIKILNSSISIINKNNNSFLISIPKLVSPQHVVYWYKVAINGQGIFAVDTSTRPGSGSSFYQDSDQSLKVQVSSYDLLGRNFAFLTAILSVFVILSGLFTFHKQNVKRLDHSEDYHLVDLFKGTFREFTYLIKAIPYRLIISIYVIIIFMYIYSYLSYINPYQYTPVDLLIYINSRYIFIALPLALLIIITSYRLKSDSILNKKVKMKYNRFTSAMTYAVMLDDTKGRISSIIPWWFPSVLLVAITCTFPLFMLLIQYLSNHIFG